MLINLSKTAMADSKEVRDALKENFLTKEKFADDVEHLVLETGLNYIDAIVEYCEQKGLEVESVGKLVSKPLKEKLRFDASQLNYLKGSANESKARLPF